MAKRPNEVDAFLATTQEPLKPVVAELRKLVRKVAPHLAEAMKYGMPSYVKEKRIVVYIMPTSDHVNLGFVDGVDLKDPRKLLEGTGKQNRHVKVWTVQDARNPALGILIEDALRLREKIDRPPKRR